MAPQCTTQPPAAAAAAPAVTAGAARLSSSLSPWAVACNNWKKGLCSRGVSCHFQHAGFPVEEKRCFICKSSEHQEAVLEATVKEQRSYGKRPLPMLNVWSRTADGLRKCRSCIAGNLQHLDPAAQRWTAQAEPSSIFTAAKLAAVRGWKVSKLDVRGAFLNAPIPDDELILVQPPAQWVAWGIVEKNTW